MKQSRVEEQILRGAEIPWQGWTDEESSVRGCLRWKNLLQKEGESPLTIGEGRIAPGQALRLHRHPQQEIYYLLKGTAEFYQQNKTVLLNRGDAVFIPAWQWHGLGHGGGEVAVHFLYIFPRACFEDVAYEFYEKSS